MDAPVPTASTPRDTKYVPASIATVLAVSPIWVSFCITWFGPPDAEVSGPEATGAAILLVLSLLAIGPLIVIFERALRNQNYPWRAVFIVPAGLTVILGSIVLALMWQSAPGWFLAWVAFVLAAFVWLTLCNALAFVLARRAV